MLAPSLAAPGAGVTDVPPWHPPRLTATSQSPIVAPCERDIALDRAPRAVVCGHAQRQGEGRSGLIPLTQDDLFDHDELR